MPQKRDQKTGQFVPNGGAYIDEKGYPRISCGPCRGQRIHRVKASIMAGRELSSSEDVHHRNGDRERFEDGNLEIMSHGAHSSLSAWERRKIRLEDEYLKSQYEAYFEEGDVTFP